MVPDSAKMSCAEHLFAPRSVSKCVTVEPTCSASYRIEQLDITSAVLLRVPSVIKGHDTTGLSYTLTSELTKLKFENQACK